MSPLILSAFFMALGLGTTIVFASSHTLLAWMGLEMGTLAIIPLMARPFTPRAIEASAKYFLVQAAGAAAFLFAGISSGWLTGQWDFAHITHPFSATLLSLSLAMKLGLAPVHTWLPEVLQGVDLGTGVILSTWQKLAPFALLLQLQPINSTNTISIGLLSIIVGGWGGLNQTQLRKILAYSSIAHLGWMTLIMQYSPSLALVTLITYFIMTYSAFMVFKLYSSTSINMLTLSWAKAPVIACLIPIILLSLGGLPPLTGFMPKWFILQELTMQGLIPLATAAAMSALLSLFFYLRLAYAMCLTSSPNNLTGTVCWRAMPQQLTLPLSISTTLAFTLLPILPVVMLLFL